MTTSAWPVSHGPGRRDELVDRSYAVSDGLGQDVPPDQTHLVGVSPHQLDEYAGRMFNNPHSYQTFDVSPYDRPPVGGPPDGSTYLRDL